MSRRGRERRDQRVPSVGQAVPVAAEPGPIEPPESPDEGLGDDTVAALPPDDETPSEPPRSASIGGAVVVHAPGAPSGFVLVRVVGPGAVFCGNGLAAAGTILRLTRSEADSLGPAVELTEEQ